MADTYGIRLFPIFSFAGTAEIEALQGTFAPYVNRDGKIFASTPCPLDGEYWVRSIAERFSQFATLSTLVPLAGILFDTEMYGSDMSVYHDLCFCDLCWNEFLQMLALSGGSQAKHFEAARFLSVTQRFSYLSRHNLQRHYTNFQEKRLEEIISRLEKHVHRIQPHIPLGFLAYVDNWFYRALIRGLGTPAQPVFVFSETWYVRGYTPLLLQERTKILSLRSEFDLHKGERPIARYIPGLWQGRFFPDDLPQQVFNVAVHSDGYWIFSADSLWSEKHRTGHYALHGSRQDYWTAFRTANTELQEFSKSPDTYESHLPSVYTASFYDSVQQTLQTQPALVDLLKQLAMQQNTEQLRADVDFRDTALFHCMNVSKKGSLRISFMPDQPFYERLSYKLFDREGVLQISGKLQNASQTIKIELSPLPAEKLSLLINSGANASSFSFEGIPCLLEASSTFPFSPFTLPQKYGIYVPDDNTQIKLRAFSPGEKKKAVITIQAPDRRLEKSLDVAEFTEAQVLTDSRRRQWFLKQAEQFSQEWAITIHPATVRTPDILLYFYDESFPYLLISPSGIEGSVDKDSCRE
ncbi:MAG: hypothetical protein GY801_12325 [bacterium]|nr:hypothetical protein [bacterium]